MDMDQFKEAFKGGGSTSSELPQLLIQWSTTTDVIFVGEPWTPGRHCQVGKIELAGKALRFSEVPLLISIQPDYVFTERDVGEMEVVLEVPAGVINGVEHGGFYAVKTVTVRRFDKVLKGKNSSDAHKKMVEDENALMSFVMKCSLTGTEPHQQPLGTLAKAFTDPIWRVMGEAKKVYSKDHYSSEAMYSEELEDNEFTAELLKLREKILAECDSVLNMGQKLLGFLDEEDVETLESTDEKARKKGTIYSREQFLRLYERLEAWGRQLSERLSQLEVLFRQAKTGSSVSEHTVGSLFKANVNFSKGVKFRHRPKYFELDVVDEGLKTLGVLDKLMTQMNEFAERLMGKSGDGLEVDSQGLKIVQMLEEVRTRILMVIADSGCPALKAALLDPEGPFYAMFNKLSAQSCADKREDLWGKFAGWWRQMSEGTREQYK